MMKFKSLRKKILAGKSEQAETLARKEVTSNILLWETLQKYLEKSTSTGCSFLDYKTLYNYVREHKPTEILECGTGVSTIVMATALMENVKDGVSGRITSIEDQEKYFAIAQQLLPEHLSPYIDLCLCPRKEYYISFYRGVGYDDLPERPYDFVFIDGPDFDAPSDGNITFDFDYINILKASNKPVAALLDGRLSTAYVLQNILGVEAVRYDPVTQLSTIGPCTKDDILLFESSSALKDSIRLNTNTRFQLDMEPKRKRVQARKQQKAN